MIWRASSSVCPGTMVWESWWRIGREFRFRLRPIPRGGIHEAISYYEDNIFYEILAEELSRRDMDYADITDENYDEIVQRMDSYMDEFEVSGVDHLVLEEE